MKELCRVYPVRLVFGTTSAFRRGESESCRSGPHWPWERWYSGSDRFFSARGLESSYRAATPFCYPGGIVFLASLGRPDRRRRRPDVPEDRLHEVAFHWTSKQSLTPSP